MNSSHADTDGHVTALIRSRQVLQADPENAAAFFEQGIALCQLGQWEQALSAWKTSARLQPGNVYAHLNMGIVLLQHARWKEAEAAFLAAARCRPDHAEAHYGLGVAYAQQTRYDDAHAAWQETLRLDPTHEEAHSNLSALIQMMTTEVTSLNISALQPLQMDCVIAGRASCNYAADEATPLETAEAALQSNVSPALRNLDSSHAAPIEAARIKLPPMSGPPLGEIAGAVFAAHDARAAARKVPSENAADASRLAFPATPEPILNPTLRFDSKTLQREHARIKRRENVPSSWGRMLALSCGVAAAAVVLTLWTTQRFRAPVETVASPIPPIHAPSSGPLRPALSRRLPTSFEAPVAVEPVPVHAAHSAAIQGDRASASVFHTHRAPRDIQPVRQRQVTRSADEEARAERSARRAIHVEKQIAPESAPHPSRAGKSVKHVKNWDEDTFAAHHRADHNDGADEWTDHLP